MSNSYRRSIKGYSRHLTINLLGSTKMIKHLHAFLVLAAIFICTPSDGQFHWAKNYRVDVQNLRERLQKLRNAEWNDFDSQV